MDETGTKQADFDRYRFEAGITRKVYVDRKRAFNTNGKSIIKKKNKKTSPLISSTLSTSLPHRQKLAEVLE